MELMESDVTRTRLYPFSTPAEECTFEVQEGLEMLKERVKVPQTWKKA